jgi:amidase
VKNNLNKYLENLEESEVRSLADVIEYNLKHAEKELPPRMNSNNASFTIPNPPLEYLLELTLWPDHPRQDRFIDSQNNTISPEVYERHLQHLRHVARDRGVERVLETYAVDVILGPTDSGLTSMAAAGGEYLFSARGWNKIVKQG